MRSGRTVASEAAGTNRSGQRLNRRRVGHPVLAALACGSFAAAAFAQAPQFSATPTVFPASGGSNGPTTATVNVHVLVPSAIRSFGIPLGFQGSPEFAVASQTGCTVDGTTVMVAGATCFVVVRFTPLGPGVRTGTLQVTDGAGKTVSFGLAGTGYYPQVAITPAAAKIVAGLGPSSAGNAGDGDAATLASTSNPEGVAADSFGNIYIADTGNNVVRMLDAFGNITTVAGGGTLAGAAADGGPATAAALVQPSWVAVDSAGNLYIAETDSHVIRKVAMSSSGTISTVAGSYAAGFSDGTSAVTAKLNRPQGIAVDPNGNLYIVDSGNQRVRVVDATAGTISTFAGSGDAGFDAAPTAALNAHFSTPAGIALDPSGAVFLGDSGNHAVRKIANGSVTVVAGTGTSGHTGDGGQATAATLATPTGLALTPAGDLYIADTGAGIVRKVEAASGVIETIAGLAKDSGGFSAGVAVATSVRMNGPLGLALDAHQNLYLADSGNNVVRLISPAPGELDFAAQAVGNTSSSSAVEVANIGNAPLTISSVAAANSATSTNFVLNNSGTIPCASSVAAGTHCAFTVAFAPQAVGFTSGEIDIVDNVGPGYLATSVHPVYLLGGLRVPLTIGPSTLASVVAGQAYSQVITAAGGFGAITTDAAGTLPSGMTFSVSGATVTLSGTPTAAGTYSLTVYASDTLGESAAQTYSIVVLPQTVNLALGETVHVTDAATEVFILTLNLGETVHVSDSIVPLTNLLLNISEAVHVTDSIVNTESLILTVNEAIQTADSVQNVTGLILTVNEGIGVADLVTPVSGLILTVPESVGVADNLQTLAGLTMTVNEAIGVADSARLSSPLGFLPAAGALPPGTVNTLYPARSITITGGSGSRQINVTGSIPGLTLAVTGAAVNISGTPTASGTYSFTVSASDSAGGTASGVYSLTVNKQPQTINAAAIPNHTYGDAPFAVSATASSGLPVTIIVASGPAALLNGQLDITGSGPITLTVTQSGDATYAAATPASLSFTAAPALLTVTAVNAGRAFATPNPAFQFALSGLVHGDSAAVVSGTPTLTTTATANSPAGTYPISIAQGTLQAANYTFNLVPGTLTVSGGVQQTITFGRLPNVPLALGPLTLTAHSTSGLLCTYTVTGPASLQGSKLFLTGPGTVTVTVTQTGNATFNAAAPVSRTFTVLP